MDASWIFPILLLVVGAALFVRGRRKNAPPKSGWRIMWSSKSLGDKPTLLGAGWHIEFPADPLAHLNYVQKFGVGPQREGAQLMARVKIVGVFEPVEGGPHPASMTLLVQRKGDPGNIPGYRYYSKKTIPLVEGDHILSVPLTIAEFGDVLSDTSQAAFSKVLAEAESVGVIFGSNGGRGHGVYGVGRPASITLEFML